jgi:hypothetical protein
LLLQILTRPRLAGRRPWQHIGGRCSWHRKKRQQQGSVLLSLQEGGLIVQALEGVVVDLRDLLLRLLGRVVVGKCQPLVLQVGGLLLLSRKADAVVWMAQLYRSESLESFSSTVLVDFVLSTTAFGQLMDS